MASPDLFSLIEAADLARESVNPVRSDAYIIALGSPSCGKTTLLSTMAIDATGLSPSSSAAASNVRATIGLEYSYIRAPPSAAREAAHVWEAGGAGAASAGEAEWLSIPLTTSRLPTAAAILFLDGAKPAAAASTAVRVIAALRKRADECGGSGGGGALRSGGNASAVKANSSSRAGSANSSIINGQNSADTATAVTRMRAGWAARGGGAVITTIPAAPLPPHPDEGLNGAPLLLPFPFLVVGTRWDTAAQLPADARRAFLAILRLTALVGGGGLACATIRDRSSLSALRGIFFSSLLGASGGPRSPVGVFGHGDAGNSLDGGITPPLLPCGADSIADIAKSIGGLRGAPGVVDLTAALESIVGFQRALDALTRAMIAALPPGGGGNGGGGAETAETATTADEDLAILFPEPAVDAACESRLAEVTAIAAAVKDKERRAAADVRAAAAAAAVAVTVPATMT